MIHKNDLLWLLATPAYILVGTFRHEASHAVAAMLQGVPILKFVFWPTYRENSRLLWGYVQWGQGANWLAVAAPYFGDLVTFLLFFGLCMTVVFARHWVWLNLVILGIVSPFVNSLYNYSGGLARGNDVGYLLTQLPPVAVHLYFISSLVLYAIGLWIVLHTSASARRYRRITPAQPVEG